MLTINLKRPRLTFAVALGVLAIAGPASAGTGAGDPPSSAAHAPVSLTPSSGGHPSQGAPTVGGGITDRGGALSVTDARHHGCRGPQG